MANEQEKPGKDMAVDMVKEAAKVIAGSLLACVAVGAMKSVVTKLTTIDHEKNSLTGKSELHPTEDSTSLSKVDTDAVKTEGQVSKDSVSGIDGKVQADETNAKAATVDATALEAGAQAVRTKAGASDIELKLLKMT
jgi:hypothetical protein